MKTTFEKYMTTVKCKFLFVYTENRSRPEVQTNWKNGYETGRVRETLLKYVKGNHAH